MGTRYPEGRTGRPREIGGRHVRKEEEGGREGGPEGLRQAHEARAGHGPEDAGAQGVVQGDREGAGQVALDGERRGRGAASAWTPPPTCRRPARAWPRGRAAATGAGGTEDVPVGELDLTPGLIARAREERGDAPLS